MPTAVPTISSDLLASTGLVMHGISTRRGGVSPEPYGMNLSFRVGDSEDNVVTNRGLFAGALGTGVEHFAIPEQRHGAVVRRADAAGRYSSCDGLATDTPGVFLCITVADCVPILLMDVRRRAIAAIHAGWRGTVKGIAGRGVKLLVREFGCRPGQMTAFLGPCAGPCCYAVGRDVADRFSTEFVADRDGGTFVDLRAANLLQLLEAGIPRALIEVSPHCTIHESGLLHSNRRDGGSSGRMMAAIGLCSPLNPVR